MTPEQALDVLRVMPEPCLLVAGDGEVLGANTAGGALLGRPHSALSGMSLASLTKDPPERVATYLGACSRSRSMVLGALTFTDGTMQPIRCRCQGAVLRPASPDDHALIVIRCARSAVASRDFRMLNRQIEQLGREVRIRQQVEAERAALLAQAREGQRHLARQAEELERARRRVEQLQAVTAAFSGALTPTQVATVVVEQGAACLDAQTSTVYLLSADRTTLQLVRSIGYPDELPDEWTRMPLDASYPVAEAARTGTPAFVATHAEWRERFEGHTSLPESNDDLSWAALPLMIDGRVLGALGLRFGRAGPFSSDEQLFMAALAQQCAQALERARLYVEAQSANHAKSQFLAVMSHELRTPLNAIAGYAELLVMGVHGPITAAQHDALGRLQRSQRRLLSLVNDVLNLARIESGAATYDIRNIPLDDALAELEALIAPQAAHRGVRYEYRPVDCLVEVRADAERLQQIVLNLLSNAVKFTDAGGRVTLSCEARESDVAIRVIDTGCGIPADKLDTIFEPFVQVDAGLTRPTEGTGLGLAISRDLARAMGGELVAHSDVGHGATFTLTVPRARCAPAPARLGAPSVPDRDAVASSGSA